MTDEERENPPGALRRALFQDVPYILDSLWRWGEFRLNRLGTVQFEDPHAYVPRAAWKCGAFLLYALMCVFAVFGPTWDALCALGGFGFITHVRNVASLLLFVAAAWAFMRLLNGVTSQLTRRAEVMAALRPATDTANESPFVSLAQTQEQVERRFQNVRVAIDRRTEEHVGNLRRFFGALP